MSFTEQRICVSSEEKKEEKKTDDQGVTSRLSRFLQVRMACAIYPVPWPSRFKKHGRFPEFSTFAS